MPQREFTKRRLCPGPPHGSVDIHASRWWRWLDPERHDGWHCINCGWTTPEVSPIDGSEVERPETLTPEHQRLVAPELQLQDYLRAA